MHISLIFKINSGTISYLSKLGACRVASVFQAESIKLSFSAGFNVPDSADDNSRQGFLVQRRSKLTLTLMLVSYSIFGVMLVSVAVSPEQHFLQYCISAQRRLKSACAFAQSDQSS